MTVVPLLWIPVSSTGMTATTVSGSNNAEAYYMNYPSCKGGLSTQTLQVYERIRLKLLRTGDTKYDHFVRCVFDF